MARFRSHHHPHPHHHLAAAFRPTFLLYLHPPPTPTHTHDVQAATRAKPATPVPRLLPGTIVLYYLAHDRNGKPCIETPLARTQTTEGIRPAAHENQPRLLLPPAEALASSLCTWHVLQCCVTSGDDILSLWNPQIQNPGATTRNVFMHA